MLVIDVLDRTQAIRKDAESDPEKAHRELDSLTEAILREIVFSDVALKRPHSLRAIAVIVLDTKDALADRMWYA